MVVVIYSFTFDTEDSLRITVSTGRSWSKQFQVKGYVGGTNWRPPWYEGRISRPCISTVRLCMRLSREDLLKIILLRSVSNEEKQIRCSHVTEPECKRTSAFSYERGTDTSDPRPTSQWLWIQFPSSLVAFSLEISPSFNSLSMKFLLSFHFLAFSK